MVNIQSTAAEIRRGKKEEEEERRNHRAKYNGLPYYIMSASATQGGHKKLTYGRITTLIFTARRHASAVYAVVMCVSVCHKSVFY